MTDRRPLDPFETALVLAAFAPGGARIGEARRCRDWTQRPYPLDVSVETDVGTTTVILKADRKAPGGA
jgi:hypothetical protein